METAILMLAKNWMTRLAAENEGLDMTEDTGMPSDPPKTPLLWQGFDRTVSPYSLIEWQTPRGCGIFMDWQSELSI